MSLQRACEYQLPLILSFILIWPVDSCADDVSICSERVWVALDESIIIVREMRTRVQGRTKAVEPVKGGHGQRRVCVERLVVPNDVNTAWCRLVAGNVGLILAAKADLGGWATV